MTGWHLGPMTPFDCESGGVNVEEHRIVTITVGSIKPAADGRPQVDMWSGLIAVDIDIDPAATEVHGITTAYAREHGKPASEVLDEAAGLLALSLSRGVPVVGMNLAFDWTILDRECRRWQVPTVSERLAYVDKPFAPVIDVLVLDKAMDRYRPGKRKLTDLCALYGVRHDGAHDATEDALAAARIAYVMGRQSRFEFDKLRGLYHDRRYPERIARDWQAMGRMDLGELHERQIRWYREQAEGLADYWLREAQQKVADADLDMPPANGDLSVDERRMLLRREADELTERAAGMSLDWPLRPLVVA